MSEISASPSKLPPEQEAIWTKCFHPSGTFVEFPIEDVETSIPARFQKMVEMYPDRLAVKMGERTVTYAELNQAANRIAWSIYDKRGAGIECAQYRRRNAISQNETPRVHDTGSVGDTSVAAATTQRKSRSRLVAASQCTTRSDCPAEEFCPSWNFQQKK